MKLASLGLLLLASCASLPNHDQQVATAPSAWRVVRVVDNGWGTASPIHCTKAGPFWIVRFLTAKHVTHGADDFRIEAPDGRGAASGILYAECEDADASVVAFALDYPVDPVPLNFDPLKPGDRVWIAGWPGAPLHYLWITEGLACSPDRVTAEAWFGNSGGPCLDEAGALRGIVVKLYGDQRPLAHMVGILPLGAIRDWLRTGEGACGSRPAPESRPTPVKRLTIETLGPPLPPIGFPRLDFRPPLR